MAIKRCPYCRSIIDEADRYCENCGTQLLFPEDENIEEDIPGEKILEAEDGLPDEDLEIPSGEESITPPFEPSPAEDEIALEQARSKKSTEIPDLSFETQKRDLEDEPLPDSARKFATGDLPEMDLESPSSLGSSVTPPFETPAEESAPPEDFEAGFPASEEEREDIARLMSAMAQKERSKEAEPPPSREEEEVAFSEKDLPPLRFEEEKPPTSDELPPWAERVKEGITPGFRTPTQEDASAVSLEREDLSFEAERGFDRLSQSAEEEPGIGDGDFRRAEPGLRPRPRRRRGPLSRLKARLYDFLMITLLWIAALWAASRVLSVPLIDIIANSALQVGVFYLILLAGYFALFFSFLGETLGDRLGSPPA